MRILYASSFDPAGVMTSHRKVLRAAGHECFLGVDKIFGVLPGVPMDPSLTTPPDVLVVCPGIGDGGGWANEIALGDQDLPAWVEDLVTLADRKGVPKVALFHGSINTAANRARYRDRYLERGFVLAATTLDYCVAMGAAYLPPSVDVGDRRAPLRSREPLLVAHTPTNPDICSTREFLIAASTCLCGVVYRSGFPHRDALDAKSICHVGFDHLRGSFSVNTLENAALGLVPLVGIHPRVAARMEEEGISPLPLALRGEEDLAPTLRLLASSPEITCQLQREARDWFEVNFSQAPVTARLVRFFESVIQGRTT